MSNAIDTYPASAVFFTSRTHCDHGNCGDPVAAVVAVTSGSSSTVEVRLACTRHIEAVTQGWSNKRVAVLTVG
jgi:hypothetical protein